MPLSQSQVNTAFQTTMYPDLIEFHGKLSVVATHIEGDPQAPAYGAEWEVPLSFPYMGSLIGKGGVWFKKIQEEVNQVHGGARTIEWEELGCGWKNEKLSPSVQAIWATTLPDGRTAITAYGQEPTALLQALQMVRDRAMKIMQNHGWVGITGSILCSGLQ